jgi:hypothetical protein
VAGADRWALYDFHLMAVRSARDSHGVRLGDRTWPSPVHTSPFMKKLDIEIVNVVLSISTLRVLKRSQS